MNHKRYQEWLQLYLYQELNEKELNEFEFHLKSCTTCSKTLNEMKKFKLVLDKYEAVQINESIVHEARKELCRTLGSEKIQKSFWSPIAGIISDFIIPKYKLALGSVALIAVGVFIGYFTFKTNNVPTQVMPITAKEQVESMEPLRSDARFSNIKFIDSDDSDGEVEFTFDAIMPVHMKGLVNDPGVQRVLAYAIISDQNPGVRLQSVSALASETRNKAPDAEVMDALISALRFDKNPGVRKEALGALGNYASDIKVKQALLDVLMRDDNAGLRIAAINALTKLHGDSIQKDTNFLEVLRTKQKTDNNNYIRLRSQAVLKEMNK